MTKKLLIAVVMLPLLAVGAYFGGEYLLARSAQSVLDRITASLPQGATFIHGALSTNLLRREVTLADVVVSAPDNMGPRSLSASSLQLRGLPWISKGNFELGELVIEGLRIERRGVITAQRWAVSEPGVSVLGHLAAGEQASGDFSFASAEATNLTISRTNPQVEASVGSVRSGALSKNRLASLEINDVKATSQDATGPLVRLAIAQVTAADLDIGRVISAEGDIDLTAPLLSNGLSALNVNSLSLGPDGGDAITMASLAVTGEGLPDGTRTALSLKGDQVVIPLAAMTAAARQFYGDLGYEKMALNFDIASRYDQAAHTFVFMPLDLDIADVGKLGLQLRVGGLANPGDMSKDPTAAQMALAAMTLNAFDLKLADGGFVKRQVESGARRLSVNSDVYIEQMINAIKPDPSATGPGAQKLAALYRAVSSFLLNPGELSITANPEKPVAFLQLLFSMNNPTGAAETLNISATNRQLPAPATVP